MPQDDREPQSVSVSRPRSAANRLRPGFIVIGILLVAANLRASITAVGPVLDQASADAGLSVFEASMLISVPLFAFAAFSPIAPFAARRFGLERTIGGSLVLLAAGIVLRSVPGDVPLWIGTVGLGAAIAAINVLLPSLLKRDFPREIGRLTGVYSAVQTAFAAASAGLAVPIAGLANEGWRLAYGIWAGLAIIALAVFAPQMRRHSPPTDELPVITGRTSVPHVSPWRRALAWQVTVFMGLQSTIFYVVITWVPAIEHSVGIDAFTAGWHQSVFQVCGIAGTLTCAALLQKWNRDQRIIVSVYSLCSAAGLAGILLAPSGMLLWLGLIGIAQGGLIVLALALFGLRTSNHLVAASLSGMAQSVGYLLAAIGPILIGTLHDATGAWELPLVVLLGVVVAQCIMGYLACRDRVIR
ncbi:MFS transporter, CP family, cyanate transporter [Paramicrobacterium humi]|uniref:MFS transporter, CP family, cyanate transporter n=1 Tax=Paramicrobacterium humi TaxID=640635 RepID=A0A1H4IQI6_9MICO|nr:MFS transporter [Microbacterium humi]SEB36320.1 MFS transporter, CP family, cyanate transporter [Microbacterium humi]